MYVYIYMYIYIYDVHMGHRLPAVLASASLGTRLLGFSLFLRAKEEALT